MWMLCMACVLSCCYSTCTCDGDVMLSVGGALGVGGEWGRAWALSGLTGMMYWWWMPTEEVAFVTCFECFLYVLWIKGNWNKTNNLTSYLIVAYLLKDINGIANAYLIHMYRDVGIGWPRLTSEPWVKSIMGELKTEVDVVLVDSPRSIRWEAAVCLKPEKGLLHFTVKRFPRNPCLKLIWTNSQFLGSAWLQTVQCDLTQR